MSATTIVPSMSTTTAVGQLKRAAAASPSAYPDHLVRRMARLLGYAVYRTSSGYSEYSTRVRAGGRGMARLIGASVASSFLGIQEYVHDSAAIGHGSELNVNVRSTRSFHAPCMPRSVLGGPLSVRQPNGIPPATWLCWALRTARVVSRVGRYALTLAEPSAAWPRGGAKASWRNRSHPAPVVRSVVQPGFLWRVQISQRREWGDPPLELDAALLSALARCGHRLSALTGFDFQPVGEFETVGAV